MSPFNPFSSSPWDDEDEIYVHEDSHLGHRPPTFLWRNSLGYKPPDEICDAESLMWARLAAEDKNRIRESHERLRTHSFDADGSVPVRYGPNSSHDGKPTSNETQETKPASANNVGFLSINTQGMIINPRIKQMRRTAIERRKLTSIHGIIVHQTGGATASSTLDSYLMERPGAHFLIDKDGVIYQTASLYRTTDHVGKLKARCIAEHRFSKEFCPQRKFNAKAETKQEKNKQFPDRYPWNDDSIGIELVGMAFYDPKYPKDEDRKIYEQVTEQQNASLKWLIQGLKSNFGVLSTEIYRHPDVSWKNKTEAKTAHW